MEYPVFKHSNSAVKRAAGNLVDNRMTLQEKLDCLSILANFRSSHNYPMQPIISYFRKKALEVDKKAIVVRRLKRIPSIIDKLKRFPGMQVTTMADIGGIRIITKNIKTVQDIKNHIVKGRTRSKLIGERDYLTHPKDSGYRGIHLIYSYQGSKTAYKGRRIELQIRSHIQHAWATAVEIVGTFLGKNLKASQGDEEWLAFFRLVSSAFACLEKNQQLKSTQQEELQKTIEELNVFDSLVSFSVAARESDKKEGFYLLKLNIAHREITAQHINKSFVQEAYEEYRRIEQEISEDTTKDVVLVSAESLKELKKAYPNYFADTHLFLVYLKKALGKTL